MQRLEKILAQTPAPNSARMAKSLRFSQGHPKPAFSEKVQRGDQGKFFKNRPKRSHRLNAQKQAGANNIILNLVCTWSAKTGKDFGAKSGSISAWMAKLWQFSQSHPKPAFSEKVQMGDQGKFFKNRPKRCPRWKGPQALWRKWHYPLISMYLKCKDWKRFWRKKRLQRVPEWPSYGNFRKVTQNPHFLKKCKGRTKGHLSKIAQTLALV